MAASPTKPRLSESMTTALRDPALKLSQGQRLFLVASGYVPFANLIVMFALAVLAHRFQSTTLTWLLPLIWLLIVPPLVVRLILTLRLLPRGDIEIGSAPFLTWWLTSQWQAIFNRLPWIEEIVRLVPGLYAVWLRLWGAKVGRLVYWTPGLRIFDRSLIDIGDRVVFGAGVKIAPHVIMRNREGRQVLLAASVRIGDDVLVGAYSILLAGSWIAPGEASPGRRELAPFTGWVNGRRIDPKDESESING
jgi:hypothetical protein